MGKRHRLVSTPKPTSSESPSSLMTTLLQSRDSKSTTHCWWVVLFRWDKHTVHTVKHTQLTMNHKGCYLGHTLRFCSISFVTLGSARESLLRSRWNASSSLLLPLGNIKREMGWRGEIKGRKRGGILVAMSVKCQNVLADCLFWRVHSTAEERWGDRGRRAGGMMREGSFKSCQRNG